MTIDKEKQIIEEYLTGSKVLDIAKQLKVSTATISKVLKEHEIQSRYKSAGVSNKSIYNEVTLLNGNFKSISERYQMEEKEIKRIYKEERNKRVVKDYKAGMTLDKLCIKYSLSNMSIYKILDKNHVERKKVKTERHPSAVISEEMKKEIIEDYTARNCSVSKLLSKYGISKHQLYALIYANNVETRKSQDVSEETKKEIITDFKSGLTRTELGRKYNVSRILIGYIVKGE